MTDTDPAINPDFWFSSGSAHLWNIGQKTPATEWERRIDELMARQIASPDEAERKRLFDEVQKIFAEHLPIVYFVAPRIYVAASARVTNLTPAVSAPAAAVVAGHGGGRRSERMLAYLARRLAFAVVPGVRRVVGVAGAGAARARRLRRPNRSASARQPRSRSSEARARYGLDRSIGAQYRDWLAARRALRFRPLAALRPAGRAI